MIQSLKKNPCQTLFQEKPFELKNEYYVNQVVCSLHKNLIGIKYRDYKPFRCSIIYKGGIIIFVLKEEKWEEYFRMVFHCENDIQLLFFVNQNNGFQLLFHKSETDCIEYLKVNQNNIFGLYSYLSGTIKVYFKLPADVETILPSKDQKMILIQIPMKFLLLDATGRIQKQQINSQNIILYFFYNAEFKRLLFLHQTQLMKDCITIQDSLIKLIQFKEQKILSRQVQWLRYQ